jgi:histidyl-tRNA synthetase
MIMMDEGFQVPGTSSRTAFLIEKGVGGQRLSDILGEAQACRKNGEQILVVRMNKNKKFQKQSLEEQGYTNFREFYKEALK